MNGFKYSKEEYPSLHDQAVAADLVDGTRVDEMEASHRKAQREMDSLFFQGIVGALTSRKALLVWMFMGAGALGACDVEVDTPESPEANPTGTAIPEHTPGALTTMDTMLGQPPGTIEAIAPYCDPQMTICAHFGINSEGAVVGMAPVLGVEVVGKDGLVSLEGFTPRGFSDGRDEDGDGNPNGANFIGEIGLDILEENYEPLEEQAGEWTEFMQKARANGVPVKIEWIIDSEENSTLTLISPAGEKTATFEMKTKLSPLTSEQLLGTGGDTQLVASGIGTDGGLQFGPVEVELSPAFIQLQEKIAQSEDFTLMGDGNLEMQTPEGIITVSGLRIDPATGECIYSGGAEPVVCDPNSIVIGADKSVTITLATGETITNKDGNWSLVEVVDLEAWQSFGPKAEIIATGADLTLWEGTPEAQTFSINPETAPQLRQAMLMHLYAINREADPQFAAKYSQYEMFEWAVESEPDKLWDIYLDTPHKVSYSTRRFGIVQPVKVSAPVALTSMSVELVAPEDARAKMDKQGGYTEILGAFGYQWEEVVGPDGKPVVQLNISNWLEYDREDTGMTAITPAATKAANARIYTIGLNKFGEDAEWMKDGFKVSNQARMVWEEGGNLAIIVFHNRGGGLDINDFERWASGEKYVLAE